jgi:protein phosphatase
MRLTITDPALVLLVGPSGSGKSTFARAHFTPTEIVSSDALRALLADDPADQGASAEAFHLLRLLVDGRLRRRLTTVVDATNLRAADRRRYVSLAARHGVRAVAIAFDFAPRLYAVHNAARPGRVVDEDVVEDQVARMRRALGQMAAEGYAAVYVLRRLEEVTAVTIERAS